MVSPRPLHISTASTNPATTTTTTLTPVCTGNTEFQLASIPFSIPDQLPLQDWMKVRNYAAHLSTNLVQISIYETLGIEEQLLDMKNILQLCGAYYRHVRSYYWCNSKEALVDFVPKDRETIPNILKFTGKITINGYEVMVNYQRAVYRMPMEVLGDYAAMLAWGRTANNGMVKDFFYPNPSWEPPVSMIPIIQVPAGSYDLDVSSNSMREALIPPQG